MPSQPINVSVIVRSMARPCLLEALDSLLTSTGIELEIVLVNARGGFHELPLPFSANSRLQIVNQDGPPLGRGAAANAGLLASRGDKLLFLDDDDLVDPDHLFRLASALELASDDVVAAYTGVRLAGDDPGQVREYNEPWSADRLGGMNFLPIHAVMFRAEAVRGKLLFDPELALLEDWDFWRRLAGLGTFLRLPGCSATYRLAFGQSGLSGRRDLDAIYLAHTQILHKAMQESPLAISRSLFWYDTALQHLQGEKATQAIQQASSNAYIDQLENRVREESESAIRYRQQCEQLEAERNESLVGTEEYQLQLSETSAALADTSATLADTSAALADTSTALACVRTELASIQQSRSWKLTAPLRALKSRLHF